MVVERRDSRGSQHRMVLSGYFAIGTSIEDDGHAGENDRGVEESMRYSHFRRWHLNDELKGIITWRVPVSGTLRETGMEMEPVLTR